MTEKEVWWANVYRVGREEPTMGHMHPTFRAAEKIGRGRKGYLMTIPVEISPRPESAAEDRQESASHP